MNNAPKKEYSNGEVIITWQPEKCTHSGKCVRGLPNVFKPKNKPWIEIENASSEQLINQIKKCPSGALGYYFQEGKDL
ncbi:(4Fe-4S)-binding protein [Algoriphagus sp.]|uniref:(4Fe-4S)-binding protein n=1 Tax=Algoriphagus sp. TaxID=1872435 RepID=UPI00391CBFB3